MNTPGLLARILPGQATESTWAERAADLAVRVDSWINAIIGFGGAKDKSAFTEFGACFEILSDPVLTSMFATEDMSRTIVDGYPRFALVKGFGVTGLETEKDTEVEDFLKPYALAQKVLAAAIWGRLYGRCAIWVGTNGHPEAPWQPGETVLFSRVVDKRYLTTSGRTEDLDPAGVPQVYNLTTPDGVVVQRIHASRLVLFGGALTDEQTKRARDWCDLSVLQVCYSKLKTDGSIWKSAELLVSEASIGVTKIKGLYAMVASGNKEVLAERIRMANMSASVARSKVLDADGEDYTRVNTTFAGLSDLTDAAVQRVAAAARYPVTILLGQAPAGLNATGASDLEWFFGAVESYRTQDLDPLVLQLLQMYLSQPDSPVAQGWEEVRVSWPPLREATAKEDADIYAALVGADVALINAQVLTPQEVALARFGVDGFNTELTLTEDQRALREEADADSGDLGDGLDLSAEGGAGAFELAPTDTAKIVTVNEARRAIGLAPLTKPDGTPDPNGGLTMAAFEALATEAASTAASSQPELGGVDGFDAEKAEAAKQAELDAKTEALTGGKGGGGAPGQNPKAPARADGYNPDQPRAEDGRFGEVAGSGDGDDEGSRTSRALRKIRAARTAPTPGSAKAKALEKARAKDAPKHTRPQQRIERHAEAETRLHSARESLTAASQDYAEISEAVEGGLADLDRAFSAHQADIEAGTRELDQLKAEIKAHRQAEKIADKALAKVQERTGATDEEVQAFWQSKDREDRVADLERAREYWQKESTQEEREKIAGNVERAIATRDAGRALIQSLQAKVTKADLDVIRRSLVENEAAMAKTEALADLKRALKYAPKATAKFEQVKALMAQAKEERSAKATEKLVLKAEELVGDLDDRPSLVEAIRAARPDYPAQPALGDTVDALGSEDLRRSKVILARRQRDLRVHEREVARTAKRLPKSTPKAE